MPIANFTEKVDYAEKKDNLVSKWIYLNVGGKRFMTTRDTLTRPCPNSFFAKLLTSGLSSAKDDTGAILIDGDCFYFREILNFLRRGTFSCLAYRREGLKAEAEYYRLDAMVAEIDRRSIPIQLPNYDDDFKFNELRAYFSKRALDETPECDTTVTYVFSETDGRVLKHTRSNTYPFPFSTEEFIGAPNDMEIISFNVGGEIFKETRQVLTLRHPNNYLAKLVNESIPSDTDENGAILIDSDPCYFCQILDYLYCDYLNYCLPYRLPALKAEAEFFEIEKMVKEVQMRMDCIRFNKMYGMTTENEDEMVIE